VDLYEHQGKELFREHGIPTPRGIVARSADEARAAAEELGGGAVIKVQVQVGGRGKGGGIVVAKTPDEAVAAAERMLSQGFKEMAVTRVLCEELVDIASEFYCAITLDRGAGKFLAMVTAEGGMDIEQLADERPDAIRRTRIDPMLGLRAYSLRWLTGTLPADARTPAMEIIQKLYEVLESADATLVEVNPLAQLADGRVIALDSKVTVDDSALYRQPEIAKLRAEFPIDPTEAKAKEKDLQYVKLDGEVGILGNGAGLVMSTLDLVAQAGGRPANFLDAGGGSSADVVATALEVILSDPAVKSVLINIFGGITRCDEVARGIVEALRRVEVTVPIVVRLDGTNADEGRRILAEANLPGIVTAETMWEGAQKAAELSKEAA
jgi:succinyl-CoA synthetase beta subunit